MQRDYGLTLKPRLIDTINIDTRVAVGTGLPTAVSPPLQHMDGYPDAEEEEEATQSKPDVKPQFTTSDVKSFVNNMSHHERVKIMKSVMCGGDFG